MTITITTGTSGVTDFFSYLQNFDDNFEASGYGTFSEGLSGDYGRSAGTIDATGDLNSQAYIMRGDVVYSMTTHTLSGSVDGIDFGYGATGTDNAGGGTDLAMGALDYSVSFKPTYEGETATDLIYDFLGSPDGDDGESDSMVELMQSQKIIFRGAAGDDVFTSFGGNDKLIGKAGNDVLKGRSGEDILSGGKGKDLLKGGAGNDKLNGGKGKDKLFGGDGEDSFVFTGNFGRDVVKDFEAGVDLLDLSGLPGEATSLSEFAAAASETGGNVIYDAGGDGANVIILQDITLAELSVSDFIFA